MNAKILSVLGVMALMVAVWFFYKEDVKVKPAVPQAPEATYEVTDIKAVQTSPETGKTEYTLTADSLVKNAKGIDEMLGIVMDWQPPEGESFHLTAKRAIFEQDTGDMSLTENFQLTRKSTNDKPDMVIIGENLIGNTKTRMVQSQNPITVTQGDDSFTAEGFTADLARGEYEFNKIQTIFNPPQTKDTPLF